MSTELRAGYESFQKLILLGSFRVDAPPTLASTKLHAKDKCLLAYLAVGSNRPVPRETLRCLLWPDFPEQRGRHSVTQSIYSLTRSFPGLLNVSKDTISLSPARVVTDIDIAKDYAERMKFDDLAELIGGRFLGDVISGSPEFEDWKDDFNSAFYRDIEVRVNSKAIAASDETIQNLHAAVIKLINAFPSSSALRETEEDLRRRVAAVTRDPSNIFTPTETASAPLHR